MMRIGGRQRPTIGSYLVASVVISNKDCSRVKSIDKLTKQNHWWYIIWLIGRNGFYPRAMESGLILINGWYISVANHWFLQFRSVANTMVGCKGKKWLLLLRKSQIFTKWTIVIKTFHKRLTCMLLFTLHLLDC